MPTSCASRRVLGRMPGAARRYGATEKAVVTQGMAKPACRNRYMSALRKILLGMDFVLTRVKGLADRLRIALVEVVRRVVRRLIPPRPEAIRDKT
ncbi:MAG: hypothetical protein Q9196_007365, partial [Gyalolechia fulgens]